MISDLHPRVRELLVIAIDALKGTDYAIGGSVVMHFLGVVRATTDVDVFASERAAIKRLRAAGLTVKPVAAPYHYIAIKEGDAKYHIDLLFPEDDPDWSAVQFPDTVVSEGLEIPVFPPHLLVISKLYANRPKDRNDIQMLLDEGAFEPALVEKTLHDMKEPAMVLVWKRLLKSFVTTSYKKPAHKRKP